MANDRDELMRLAERVEALATDWGSLEEAEKRDAIAADLRTLAQRAPQNGAVPEGWRIRKDGDKISIMAPKAIPGAMRFNPRDLEDPGMFDTLPIRLLYALADALLAAAPAPEASKCGPACARCGSTTGAACSDHGCHYLTAGNGAPEAERIKCAACGDTRIVGEGGVRMECWRCEAANPTPPPSRQPEGVEALEALIADDGYACTFQSMGQYRSALLRFSRRLASAPQESKPGGLDDYERIYAEVIQVCADQPMAHEIASRLASTPALNDPSLTPPSAG